MYLTATNMLSEWCRSIFGGTGWNPSFCSCTLRTGKVVLRHSRQLPAVKSSKPSYECVWQATHATQMWYAVTAFVFLHSVHMCLCSLTLWFSALWQHSVSYKQHLQDAINGAPTDCTCDSNQPNHMLFPCLPHHSHMLLCVCGGGGCAVWAL